MRPFLKCRRIADALWPLLPVSFPRAAPSKTKDSVGAEKEANWLPAPNHTIYLVMASYWPKTEVPSILPPGEGTWKPPGVVQAK